MNYSLGKVIKIFRNQLISLYPLTEINSFLEIVLENELNFSKIDIIMKSDERISEQQANKIFDIINRLKQHEPIQYIIGKSQFYNLEYTVKKGVLIPRPETEELVNQIIKQNGSANKLNILDIGTGSGCIAVSLKSNLPNSNVWAYDISETAMKIAKENAKLNNCDIHFVNQDILTSYNKIEDIKFDIIVSNPPYVRHKEAELMSKNVLNYEPHLALFVDNNNPLLFYKSIANYARLNLKISGRLYFEINEAFGSNVYNLLESLGYQNIELSKDLNGKDRFVSAIFQK